MIRKRADRPVWSILTQNERCEMNKIFILILMAILVCAGCDEKTIHRDAPPPGWKIVQDGFGYYTFQIPSGLNAYEFRATTIQGAIDNAWFYEENKAKAEYKEVEIGGTK